MLFRLLKNASKWAFNYLEESGRLMNEAEERIMFGDKNERKEKQISCQVFDMESCCFIDNVHNIVRTKQGYQYGNTCNPYNKWC